MLKTFFLAIAHPTRRRVLELLNRGDRSAGALWTDRKHGRGTLSEHLRVLRTTGLVTVHRRGTSLIYRLNRRAMVAGAAWLTRFNRTA